MNNTTLNYQLPTFTGLMSHGWARTAFVRDTADTAVQTETDYALEAQVRSGDYFVTLATTLDQLARQVPTYQVQAQLEDAVSDLIYLQDNYTITKNEPSK